MKGLSKMQKILIALRKYIRNMHDAYFPFAELVVSEEYVLRNGRRIKLLDDDQHGQILKLTSKDGCLITKLCQGGYTVEASPSSASYTAERTLTDDIEHNLPVLGREVLALEWALGVIKELIEDAPGIVGTDEED